MNIQFPPSLPDEVLISRASRFHILNDGPTIANTFKILFDSKPYKLSSLMPPYLERLALKLPGTPYKELTKLYEENTLYPLLRLFNGTRIENIDSPELNDLKISFAPKRVVGESGKTYLCPDCVREDSEEFGVPYIHRAHQIPGAFVCYRHGSLLLDSCSNCGCPFETIREFVTSPWHGCVCEESVHLMSRNAEIQNYEAAIGYAKFAYELLQNSNSNININAKVLSETYRSKAISLGHKYGKSLSRRDLHDSIEKFYGKEFLSLVDDAYAKGRVSGWYSHFVEVATYSTPLSRHLLTAYYLFRKAESFIKNLEKTKQRVEQYDDLVSSKEKIASKKPVKTRAYKKSKKRNISKQYVDNKSITLKYLEKTYQENPEYSLNDFWEKHRTKMKKLVSKHKEEFEQFKEFISSDIDTAVIAISNDVGILDEDSVLANKLVYIANEMYKSIDKPEKITKHSVLKAAGISASKYLYDDGFPKIKERLDECVESQWHYHARRILWAKLIIGDRSYPISEVTQISGVNHRVATTLDEYFKNATNNLKPQKGVITRILKKYKIDRNWEGPDPDKEYHLNGRNYIPVANR